MTHELLLLGEREGEEIRRAQLIEKALTLWRNNAENYRVLPLKYTFLLREKKRLKMRPVNQVSSSVLKEYPEIKFFRILDESEAAAFVADFPGSAEELDYMVSKIEYIVSYNHAYNTLKNWVQEASHLIKMKEYTIAKRAAMLY